MRRWAVSTFYEELDVLEIRLATLDALSDVIVLAEATVDQRGNAKPLHLRTVLDTPRFARWRDRIRLVEVDDMPTGPADHWARENHQRNALSRGMADLAADDVVLISDIDEIPYPDALEEATVKCAAGGGPTRFPMDMHVYRLNWRWRERPVQDGSTAVVRLGAAFWDEHGYPRPVHDALLRLDAPWRCDEWGMPVTSGWHLAYMGDAERIARKTLAIADDGFAQLVPEEKRAARPRESWSTVEWAQHCIDSGEDIYGRDARQAVLVPLNTLPHHVANNQGRFSHLLAPQHGPSRPPVAPPTVWAGPGA